MAQPTLDARGLNAAAEAIRSLFDSAVSPPSEITDLAVATTAVAAYVVAVEMPNLPQDVATLAQHLRADVAGIRDENSRVSPQLSWDVATFLEQQARVIATKDREIERLQEADETTRKRLRAMEEDRNQAEAEQDRLLEALADIAMLAQDGWDNEAAAPEVCADIIAEVHALLPRSEFPAQNPERNKP